MLEIVFASIGGLIGLALLVGGVAVLAAYAFGRDDTGYVNSDRQQLESPTYAITAEAVDLGADEIDWAPERILGNVRVQVDSATPLFIGIGSDGDVDRYLGDVAREELIDFAGEPEFDSRGGRAPRTAPGDHDFWVVKSEGVGEQALTWDAEFGRWTVVVMNADGGREIDVEAAVGVKLDWAIWPGIGMFLLGLVMTGGALIVILTVARRTAPSQTAG